MTLYEIDTGMNPDEVDERIIDFLKVQESHCAPVHRIAHELKITRHAILLRLTPLVRARRLRVVGINLCLMEQV